MATATRRPAPYTPQTQFSQVFDDAFSGKTLGDVIGGSGGALETLGAQSVAALLNAASDKVQFDMTPDEVVRTFNEAFRTRRFEAAAGQLQRHNGGECPAQ